MTQRSLASIAGKMADIDIAMLSTHTKGGNIASRPMSNNGDVEYDGDSYYFAMQDTLMVKDIEKDPKVALSFQGKEGFHVAVEGKAELVRDKKAFREHWAPDLDEWFEKGVDTDGLVMIKVQAVRAHYWDGEEEGEVKLSA